MKFVQIDVENAATVIANRNPNNNLYFLRYSDSDLKNYNQWQMDAKIIPECNWFLRLEGDKE